MFNHQKRKIAYIDLQGLQSGTKYFKAVNEQGDVVLSHDVKEVVGIGTSQKDGSPQCSSYSIGRPSSSAAALTPSKRGETFSRSVSIDIQTNFKMRNETRKSLLLQKVDLEKSPKNLSKSPFLKSKVDKVFLPYKDGVSAKPSVPTFENVPAAAGLHAAKGDEKDLDSNIIQIPSIPSYSQGKGEEELIVDVTSIELIPNCDMVTVNDNIATDDYDSDDSLCLRMSPPCGDVIDLDNDLDMEPIVHVGFSDYAENQKQTENTVSEAYNIGNDGDSGHTSSTVSGNMNNQQGSDDALSLDDLLAEKEETEVKNRNVLLMQKELKEGIKRGGFVQVLQDVETAEEEFLPEQKRALEMLQVFESEIKEVHPGQEVFHPKLFQQLFQHSLSPSDCGFKKGDSMIDALLSNLETELLADFLTSGVLTMCFHKVSCPEIICQWLFYTLSISRNSLVVQSCQRILMDLIQTQASDTPDLYTWCPKPLDLLKIFINYGAEESFLLSDQQFYAKEEIRTILQPSAYHQKSGDTVNLNLIGQDNFRGILETLSFALQARPDVEREEITIFIELLVRAAMDKSFNSNKFHYEFQVAIASGLHCYDKSVWADVIPDLSKRLSQVTKHHHNKVYLAQLLPPGSRGLCIQKRLAAMFLHEEMTGEVMKSCPETIDIKSLFQYVDCMREMIKKLDLYKLSSCVVLMDLVVGVEKLSSEQKDYLVQLGEMISFLKGDLRDNVQMMDKTRVKDLMVRTSSKWTLMIQTMGYMQTNLFPWTRNRYVQEMKIERLEVESDQESESSETDKTPTKADASGVHGSKPSVMEIDNDNVQTKTTGLANNESQPKYVCKDDCLSAGDQLSLNTCVPSCETLSETEKETNFTLQTQSRFTDKDAIETPLKPLMDDEDWGNELLNSDDNEDLGDELLNSDWGDELLNSDDNEDLGDDLLNSDDDSLPEL